MWVRKQGSIPAPASCRVHRCEGQETQEHRPSHTHYPNDGSATDDVCATRIEPRLAGNSGYLVQLAAVRSGGCAEAVLPDGRDLRDLAVLTVLTGNAISQARLGEMLDINRTSMIWVIDRLETARLVRRERDPADRRRYALQLTDEGVSAVAEMTEAIRDVERTLTDPLGPNRPARLRDLLRRIVGEFLDPLPESLTGRMPYLLNRAGLNLRADTEIALRDAGLEQRCVRILLAFDNEQPCTQEQLAARMNITSSTLLPALDDYQAGGLLSRDRNPRDRREHVLRLTPAGDDYLARALTAHDRVQHDLAERLGHAETTELNRLLTALLDRNFGNIVANNS